MELFFTIEINALLFSVLFLFISLFLLAFKVNKITCLSLVLLLVFNLIISLQFFPVNYYLFSSFSIQSSPEALFTKLSFLLLFGFFYLFLIVSKYSLDEFEIERSFLYFVILTATLFLAGSHDPLTIFIFIEMVSLASFGLIALAKNRYGYEAATKYLIFSSVASCFFVVAFILGDTNFIINLGAVNNYSFFFPAFFDNYSTSLAQFLLAISFFMKFGLGPFSSWLVDAYEASKFRDFVFISTVGKLPLVIAFSNVFLFTLTETIKYFFIVFIFIFAILAATLIVKQKKIRRFFAYSSLFNFALGFIIFFSSGSYHQIFSNYFIYYTLISLLGYISFDLYASHIPDNSEPLFIENLKNLAGTPASTCFAISIIMNSGLPPFGIFLMKATAFGFFLIGSSYSEFGVLLLVSFFFLVLSMVNMFAYFRLFSKVIGFEMQSNPGVFSHHNTNVNNYEQVYLFIVGFLLLIPVYYLWMYTVL
jgi:NADH:ubiquinone oxidoreductase subunit 2 (subunit N)